MGSRNYTVSNYRGILGSSIIRAQNRWQLFGNSEQFGGKQLSGIP